MSSKPNINLTTTTTTVWKNSITTSEIAEMPDSSDENLRFIFVPLAVLITIMFLSAMVYMMARNRRKFSNFYKRVHVPSFTFEPSDLEDEDPTECLLRGKLHIDNSYDQYQIQTYNEKRELYT